MKGTGLVSVGAKFEPSIANRFLVERTRLGLTQTQALHQAVNEWLGNLQETATNAVNDPTANNHHEAPTDRQPSTKAPLTGSRQTSTWPPG